MSFFNWSEVPVEYNWVTGDSAGVFAWGERPRWHSELKEYVGVGLHSDDSYCLKSYGVKPFIEHRQLDNSLEPGKIVEDKYPPAIIPTVNETLNLLDYLLFESESELSPEDRLKIVDHMRALSKALKEWENY